MKEKLEKAKNFVYDHKEEIAFTALVGACCTVWYLAGKKSGYKAFARDLKEKLCKDASDFSDVVNGDTPVKAYTILFKV